jgi:hypothetical protein
LVLVSVAGQKEGVIPKEYIVNTNNLMDGLAWLKANNHLYAGIKIPVFPSEESTPPVIEINCDSRKLRHDENIRNYGWLPETSVTENDSVLPQVDFRKYIEDKNTMPVYDIQRNKNSPINMFSDDYVEQMAFPTLFHKGINRLRTPRKQNETVLQYFQSRLLFCDNRWQSNRSYLFWATNLTEKQKLSEGIDIAARIRSSKTTRRQTSLTAGQVRQSFKNNPDYREFI